MDYSQYFQLKVPTKDSYFPKSPLVTGPHDPPGKSSRLKRSCADCWWAQGFLWRWRSAGPGQRWWPHSSVHVLIVTALCTWKRLKQFCFCILPHVFKWKEKGRELCKIQKTLSPPDTPWQTLSPRGPLLGTSRLAIGRRLSVDGRIQQEACGHGTCFPLRFSFCCHKGDPESWFTIKIQTGLEKNGQ